MTGPKLTEVTRSFTRKLNLGNYESADFFCSQKVECEPKDAATVSSETHAFCYSEVMKSVAAFKAERRKLLEKQRERSGR